MAWTGRMFRLIVADPEEISEGTLAALEDIQASKEQDVPKVFIRFLNQRTLRLAGMSELEANTTRMYIKMIGKFFDKQRRLYTPFLTGKGIHAYVHYLNTLVSRRKPLESVSDGSEKFTIFYRCCCNIGDMLASWLNGPLWICEAMDAGLINSLFHAERFHRHTPPNILEPKLDVSFCLILKQIALYMVYPAVLRRFLRLKKKIVESGLEEKKLEWPTDLRAFWDLAGERATGLEEIRRTYEPSHASGIDTHSTISVREKRNLKIQTPLIDISCARLVALSCIARENALENAGRLNTGRNVQRSLSRREKVHLLQQRLTLASSA
ncbi:hypothetical protein VNI00_016883 [Paramarasmius palmivorus]|uniref:Uncharacterized protein n=1 Tax=Paramarasmius palmivorus TaxID=297713 RepID=A0AAW0BAA9_9AGAR